MIVKILDTKTNRVKWLTKSNNCSAFWWSEGNGSCDCNRRIFYEREISEHDENEDESCTCHGYYNEDESCTYHRYYIIDTFEGDKFTELVNDYKYDFDKLHLYNEHYDNYTEIFYLINKLRARENKINEILND